jgi:flagellar protein FlgJ
MTTILPTLAGQVAVGGLSGQAQAKEMQTLAQAAKDFESVMVSELLKQMRQTLEPGGFFGQDAGDVHGGLFDHFLGKHLVESGGFGLARMLVEQMGQGPGKKV